MPPSEASAPGSSGKNRPWSRKCSLSCLRVMPGSTTQSRSCAFTASTRFMSRKSIDTPPWGALMWPSSEVPVPKEMTGTRRLAQMRTMSCTSSVACGKTTASGGSFAIQLVVLACCSRTAREVTSRLPNFAASAATAASIALGSRRVIRSDFSCTNAIANSRRAGMLAQRRRQSTCRRRPPTIRASPSGQLAPERNEHPDLSAVALVLLAEQLDEVSLLQEDADEDVGGRHGREQQMSDRHDGGCPECDDETEIDRMPHQLVEHRGLEAGRGHRAAREVDRDLVQPEQLEVIDQEGADQDEQPAGERQAHHRRGDPGVGDLPDDLRHRMPQPEQQDQHQAGQQHVCAALDRGRDESRPPTLERLARHHAVLNREQRHQQDIDDQRLCHRRNRPAVDSLGYRHAGNEADGVEEGPEEYGVGQKSEQKSNDPSHYALSLVRHPQRIASGCDACAGSRRRWAPDSRFGTIGGRAGEGL